MIGGLTFSLRACDSLVGTESLSVRSFVMWISGTPMSMHLQLRQLLVGFYIGHHVGPLLVRLPPDLWVIVPNGESAGAVRYSDSATLDRELVVRYALTTESADERERQKFEGRARAATQVESRETAGAAAARFF